MMTILGQILGWILKMNLGWILGGLFCGGSRMEDSDLDLMMMDAGVNSGSELLWRILGLILLWILIQI